MNRMTGFLLGALLLTALVPRDAAAQWNVARFDAEPDRVYTSFGLDPAWVPTLGYGRIVPISGHAFQLFLDAGVVAAHMDTGDFRARLGMQTSLATWRSLRLTGSAAFITRGTENDIYRALDFGSDFTGTLGVYRQGWFAGGDFGFDKAIITHITNSDWYRAHYYADAKDGWYLNAGGNFHYGPVLGLTLGRTELTGRFGWFQTENWEDSTIPMYASFGVGVGF